MTGDDGTQKLIRMEHGNMDTNGGGDWNAMSRAECSLSTRDDVDFTSGKMRGPQFPAIFIGFNTVGSAGNGRGLY